MGVKLDCEGCHRVLYMSTEAYALRRELGLDILCSECDPREQSGTRLV